MYLRNIIIVVTIIIIAKITKNTLFKKKIEINFLKKYFNNQQIKNIKIKKNTFSNLTEEMSQYDFKNLKDIVNENGYVNSCVSNKTKDYNSLSYLIDRDLSQSDCIKLGTGIEQVLKDVVAKRNPKLKNIKPKNKKGQKERDHLFEDEASKTIYYAELKSNLNLDTEKCKSTSNKCSQILEELKQEFPEHTIKMYLLGIRYYKKELIPKVINSKYSCIEENVLGVNDYLREMNADVCFETEEMYKEFLNHLADKMFEDKMIEDKIIEN